MATVAILGSTGSVGGRLAKALLERQHQVVLLGRDEAKLNQQSMELQCRSYAVDLSNSAELARSLASTVACPV